MSTPSKNIYFIIVGIVGSLISLIGLTQTPAQPYYVLGSSLLFITSFYFRLNFFLGLETILIAGHGAILLGIGSTLQLALPILLCLQLLIFFYLSDQLHNPFLIIGILGIATLSIGIAFENQWIFFLGSTAIAICAFNYAQKNRVALIWACLNVVFAVTAIIRIISL